MLMVHQFHHLSCYFYKTYVLTYIFNFGFSFRNDLIQIILTGNQNLLYFPLLHTAEAPDIVERIRKNDPSVTLDDILTSDEAKSKYSYCSYYLIL